MRVEFLIRGYRLEGKPVPIEHGRDLYFAAKDALLGCTDLQIDADVTAVRLEVPVTREHLQN